MPAQRAGIVERDGVRRVDTQRPQQRCLDTFAQLEREDVRAIQHASALPLQRSYVGKRQWHCPGMTANVCAGTGLVEIELCSGRLVIGERGPDDVESAVRNAATLERGKQRLLPL